MADAPRWAAWAGLGLGAIISALILVMLTLAGHAVSGTYRVDPELDLSYGQLFIAVWRTWHVGSWFGPAEQILFWTVAVLPVVMAVGAWLFWPTIHRSGPARAAYGRSFRVMIAGLGIFNVLLFLSYGGFVAVRRAKSWGVQLDDIHEMLGTAAILAAVCGLICWLSAAARGAAGDEPIEPAAPRCEGCGYDLAHVPSEGVCSECGLDIAVSLTADVRRRWSSWDRDPTPQTWLKTTIDVIRSPGRFFGRVRMRKGERAARRFAACHYAAIGAGAGVWVFISMFLMAPHGAPLLGIPVICTFFFGLAACGTHRALGSAAATWWAIRGSSPNPVFTSRIIHFESAWLWVLCAYNGVLITSFLHSGGRWMSDLVGSVYIGGLRLPPQPASLLLGTVGLCVAWLWRLGRAAEAGRWSNF